MNWTDTELEAILNRLADGIGSEADEGRLHEMLRSSVEARQAYREFVTLHATLQRDYVTAPAQEPPRAPLLAPEGACEAGKIWSWAWLLPGFLAATMFLALCQRRLANIA